MTEIQAALGYSQMDRIDSFIKKRHEIASVYDSKLSNLPLKLLKMLIISRHFICM